MPKKKGHKKTIPKDFTLNDSANAPKPVGRVKKSKASEANIADIPWDQVPDDALENFDIVQEFNDDGTKNIVYKKKRHGAKQVANEIDDRPGITYPEIVWYLISKYIKPEDIGRFAGINKTTYAITGQKTFWRDLYKKYCEKDPKLPERLKIENSYRNYGLKQRVIRALYYTYDEFLWRLCEQSFHDCKPHKLVGRRCVNMWFCKGTTANWSIFFKFKKLKVAESNANIDVIQELGRIEANPEESSQVMEVTCQQLNEVPPLMGMTLSSVCMLLSQGFRHHRMHLGFNTSTYAVCKEVLPECTVVLDTVKNIMVFDWWHPKYPSFDNRIPWNMGDEEALPVLKTDFFTHESLLTNPDCGIKFRKHRMI